MTADTFLRNLKKSGLLNESQFQELAVLSNRENKHIPADQIIQYCLSNNLLSQWQIDQLKCGKYKGFFLGKFKLTRVLGAGGMSAVFLAEHTLSGQQRAIKILPRKKLDEKSYLARFYREGRAVAALSHPNIIRIYDIAEENNTHYMVMEYVRGADLHQLVKKNGPLNFKDCTKYVRQTAEGLGHAHQNDLIHRDVKPANLLLTEDHSIKILDLGLALLKIDGAAFGLSAQHNETMMGTADFLAPEQAVNSNDVDRRADIYSLGCTFYFLLTGRPPFPTGTLAQRIAAHQCNQPLGIKKLRADCPEHLIQICEKMIAKNPNDRFPTCQDLVQALTEPPKIIAPDGHAKRVSIKKTKGKSGNKNLPIILLLAGLFVAIAVLVVILINQNR